LASQTSTPVLKADRSISIMNSILSQTPKN
jgi:hypothetical protein